MCVPPTERNSVRLSLFLHISIHRTITEPDTYCNVHNPHFALSGASPQEMFVFTVESNTENKITSENVYSVNFELVTVPHSRDTLPPTGLRVGGLWWVCRGGLW